MPPTGPAHLLIPFASRQSPACQSALPALRLPQLTALLARLTPQPPDAQDEDSLSPPHERALADALGMRAPDGCIPWAARQAQRLNLPEATSHAWADITLCHWQIGLAEVVMDDPAQLAISGAESEALLGTMRPYFEEDGIALFPTDRPGRWLARAALFDGLPTAAIDRAAQQPLGAWLPLSEAARPLRRLQNEMQMLLYTAPVNDERAARGLPPVNSFWLSGTGRLPEPVTAAEPRIDSRLRDAALRDDAPAWTQAWQALDAGPIADLLAASRRGEPVRITLCGDRAARDWVSAPRGLLQRIQSLFGTQPTPTLLNRL
jgi:hypothetical protein